MSRPLLVGWISTGLVYDGEYIPILGGEKHSFTAFWPVSIQIFIYSHITFVNI